LDNFEVLIFKIPHYPSLMPSTCQCHINYQLSQNLQNLQLCLPRNSSTTSTTSLHPRPLNFTLFDGPLLHISSSSLFSPTSPLECVTPISLYLHTSFPILELFFPCQLIQATLIQDDTIELSLFTEYNEKKYYWVREEDEEEKREGEKGKKNNEMKVEEEGNENEKEKKDIEFEELDSFIKLPSSSSSSPIIKIYSKYHESTSASHFIISSSNISLVKKDSLQSLLLGTRKNTLLWMDSNQSILHHTLLLPHIPIEM